MVMERVCTINMIVIMKMTIARDKLGSNAYERKERYLIFMPIFLS